MRLISPEIHGVRVGDGVVSRKKTEALFQRMGEWMLGRSEKEVSLWCYICWHEKWAHSSWCCWIQEVPVMTELKTQAPTLTCTHSMWLWWKHLCLSGPQFLQLWNEGIWNKWLSEFFPHLIIHFCFFVCFVFSFNQYFLRGFWVNLMFICFINSDWDNFSGELSFVLPSYPASTGRDPAFTRFPLQAAWVSCCRRLASSACSVTCGPVSQHPQLSSKPTWPNPWQAQGGKGALMPPLPDSGEARYVELPSFLAA